MSKLDERALALAFEQVMAGMSPQERRDFEQLCEIMDPEDIHRMFAEETSSRGILRGIGQNFADIGNTFLGRF